MYLSEICATIIKVQFVVSMLTFAYSKNNWQYHKGYIIRESYSSGLGESPIWFRSGLTRVH
jgi:hypothetical protein